MNTETKPLLHLGLHAQREPHRPAVIMGGTGEVLTFAMLEDRSRRLAAHLKAAGLKRGDHVAILMHNSADYFVATWAAQRSGLYYTPVNWHLATEEISYIVRDCQAQALLVSQPLLPVAQTLVTGNDKRVVCLTTGPAQGGFQSLQRVCTEQAVPAGMEECEGHSMLYSSGTTGQPKGVLRQASFAPWGTPTGTENLVSSLYKLDANATLLSLSPLYHAAPLNWAMATLRHGGTVVVMEKFDPREVLRLIERHRVTHGHFVPSMFVRMLDLPAGERESDLSSLRYVVHAAAPCSVDVKRRIIEWFGPIVHEYYAGSEANGVCAVNTAEWLQHPGTVGRPMFGHVHILDDEYRELPAGEVGTIYFGGLPPFEYHNDAEKSRKVYSPQGYSTLGDYGHVNQEGYVFIADRRTDLILSGGVNVYPRETEEALQQHPAVADVAVIGVPSREFGQDVLAVVQLRAGFEPGDALAAELIAFSRSRIAHYKCPRRIEFGELPRTETGKLLRRVLKDQYAAT